MGSASGTEEIADRLRAAVAGRDIATLGALLADDVRWGDDGFPRSCRSRADVLRMLATGIERGLEAEILEAVAGDDGVLLGLLVRRHDEPPDAPGRVRYLVFMVREGLVSDIRPFDERSAAAAVAGVA